MTYTTDEYQDRMLAQLFQDYMFTFLNDIHNVVGIRYNFRKLFQDYMFTFLNDIHNNRLQDAIYHYIVLGLYVYFF